MSQGFKAGNHGYVASDIKSSSEKSSEVDLSDESLTAAWKDVTNDKTPTNWCAFGFTDSEKSTKLVAIGSGSGGYSQLKSKLLSSEWNSKVVFGAFRVHCTDRVVDNSGTVRPKFVSFTNIGSTVKEYDRAAANFQKGKVRPFFGGTQLALDMRGTEIESLYTPKYIAKLMDDACAAHKPSHYAFGDGTEIAIRGEGSQAAADDDEDADEDFD